MPRPFQWVAAADILSRGSYCRSQGVRVYRVRGAVGCLALLAAALSAAPARAASIELSSRQAYPESLSAAADGTLYVGSAGAGGVLKVAPGSLKAEQWIAPAAFGSR